MPEVFDNLPEWDQGKIIDHADLNALRNAIRALALDYARNKREWSGQSGAFEGGGGIEIFPAAVLTTSTPSADYTDNRYFVKRQSPADSQSYGDLFAAQDETAQGIAETLIATNLGEQVGNTHSLADKTTVLVFGIPMPQTGSNPFGTQYVFDHGSPGNGGLDVNLSTHGGANATTPTGYSTYTYDATDADTGATLGTNLTPVAQRPQGILHGAATHGRGRYSGGSFVLWWTDETILLTNC